MKHPARGSRSPYLKHGPDCVASVARLVIGGAFAFVLPAI
jgi:hypothetical protein